MEQRIAELDNVYFERIVRVFRYAGLVIPIVIVIIGGLVRAGFLDKQFYSSDIVYFGLSSLFILIGVLQWRNQDNDIKKQATLTALFHALGLAYLIFVTGYSAPFLICYAILYVSTDIYFGTRASYISLSSFLLGLLIFFWLHPHLSVQSLTASLVGAVFICALGYITTRIRVFNEQERRSYNRVRRQESLQAERLTTLINAMGDAVINTDDRGIIRVYNAATLDLLDTNATLSGKRIDNVLKLVDSNNHEFDIFAYTKATDHVFSRRDLRHQYSDGEKINLYINVSPIRPGYRQSSVQNGYIFIMRDITKEKSLEEERDEFISVISHELRTPIAIVEGNLSNVKFILDQKTEVNPTALQAAVVASHEQAVYLANMINDLSTLSRAERGIASDLEELRIADMLQNIYNEYRPQAEAKHLQLNLDTDPGLGSIVTSRLYLEEILQNLITNAIKYTPKGNVTIHAHKEAEGIRFAISDTGIGISKTDQKHLFEKFYRSEDYRTRETTGTGLGLYVTQKLAAKLGITIELKSRLNHGSTFSFLLKAIAKG